LSSILPLPWHRWQVSSTDSCSDCLSPTPITKPSFTGWSDSWWHLSEHLWQFGGSMVILNAAQWQHWQPHLTCYFVYTIHYPPSYEPNKSWW
jgi:hypothetical protein